MKTAMQELIEEIINSKERGEIIVSYDLFCREFLEKEKQQIIDAVKETSMHGEEMAIKQANKYYNETFKNK